MKKKILLFVSLLFMYGLEMAYLILVDPSTMEALLFIFAMAASLSSGASLVWVVFKLRKEEVKLNG